MTIAADLRKTPLSDSLLVRPIAAVWVQRQCEPSRRPGTSACRVVLRNCADWKPALRRAGISGLVSGLEYLVFRCVSSAGCSRKGGRSGKCDFEWEKMWTPTFSASLMGVHVFPRFYFIPDPQNPGKALHADPNYFPGDMNLSWPGRPDCKGPTGSRKK